MLRHAKLQIIGPATVFAMLLAAESAAYALALHPSSPMLWSLNLQLFGIFQKGRYVLSSQVDIAYVQIVGIGLPLLLAAGYGLAFKRRFALAAASSLTFMYVAFLLCAAYTCDVAWRLAPFDIARILSGPGAAVVGLLLGASLLSLIVSHMSYLTACRAEANGAQSLRLRDGVDRDGGAPVLRGVQ
jgi:hypothetical protein